MNKQLKKAIDAKHITSIKKRNDRTSQKRMTISTICERQSIQKRIAPLSQSKVV